MSRGATYDSGALIAAERGDRRMWSLHTGFLAEGVVPVVPAPVLAQVWRDGRRQVSITRLLAPCVVEPMGEDQARRVGLLAAATGHRDIVDLTVVEGAVRREDAIVTSDDADLAGIAASAGLTLRIEPI